jgi:hypothetical protein
MKVLFSILILLLGSASSASQAGNHEEFIPVCGAIVAKKYLPEVKIPNVSDHYQHCSLSCVMTIYCGVMDSFEVGVLKEIYDALGYGTPSIQDLRADISGIRFALRFKESNTRADCYQACLKKYP